MTTRKIASKTSAKTSKTKKVELSSSLRPKFKQACKLGSAQLHGDRTGNKQLHNRLGGIGEFHIAATDGAENLNGYEKYLRSLKVSMRGALIHSTMLATFGLYPEAEEAYINEHCLDEATGKVDPVKASAEREFRADYIKTLNRWSHATDMAISLKLEGKVDSVQEAFEEYHGVSGLLNEKKRREGTDASTLTKEKGAKKNHKQEILKSDEYKVWQEAKQAEQIAMPARLNTSIKVKGKSTRLMMVGLAADGETYIPLSLVENDQELLAEIYMTEKSTKKTTSKKSKASSKAA